MISAMDVLNIENSQCGSQRSKQSSKPGIIKGQSKVSASMGLSFKNVNTTQDTTSVTLKPKLTAKPVKKEDEDIEYMPDVAIVEDDYADIIPLEERVSLKHLRLIFSAPSAGDSFSEGDKDFDGFPLPEPSETAEFLLAEEVTDIYEPCMLSEISFDDESQ